MACRLLPALLALLLVTAGCSGLAGQTTGTTATETTTTATTASTSESAADGPTAAELRQDALAATAAVETYRVNGTLNQTIRNNRLTRRTNTSLAGVFDRSTRRLRINQTVTALGRQVEVAVYLVDGTLYQYNPQLRQRFGSAWIRFDLSGNESRAWNASDTLGRQYDILNGSTVSLAGTATVDGRETYVIEANATDAGGGLFGPTAGAGGAGGNGSGGIDVSRLTATYYLEADTRRPVLAVVRLNASVALNRSTTDVEQTARLRFSGYGTPADVDLPAGADTAVNGSEITPDGGVRP